MTQEISRRKGYLTYRRLEDRKYTVGQIYTGAWSLVSIELTNSARPQALRSRKDLFQPRRLDAVDTVRPPGGKKR